MLLRFLERRTSFAILRGVEVAHRNTTSACVACCVRQKAGKAICFRGEDFSAFGVLEDTCEDQDGLVCLAVRSISSIKTRSVALAKERGCGGSNDTFKACMRPGIFGVDFRDSQALMPHDAEAAKHLHHLYPKSPQPQKPQKCYPKPAKNPIA